MNEIVLTDRPVVGPAWQQLGIMVNDGSGSIMDTIDVGSGESAFTGTKAQAIAAAEAGLFDRMKIGRKAGNFEFAEVCFTDRVTGSWGPTAVGEIDTFADFDPTRHGTGGTLIGAGLEKAEELAQQFLAAGLDGLPKSVVVLLLTDGQCGDAERTRAVAARLTADPRITLACAFFATKGQPPAGLGLLQQICSQPANVFCRTVYDPETLREFFHRSMTNPASLPGTDLATGATR